VRIQEVKIANFKGIDEWNIKFKPGFNLIKGENGKGKTSILEAIAVGLGGFVAGLQGVATRHFSRDEIRLVYQEVGDGSYDKKYMVPVEVSLKAELDGEEFEWTRGRSSAKASRSTIQPKKICKKAEQMANESGVVLPILAYQGAGRVWAQRRERSENIFRKQYFRTVGYTDALLEASNNKLLLNWCVRMEQVAWQKGMKIAEYEAVKRAVADFMKCMEQNGEYEVFYDKQQEDLMYRNNDVVLPVCGLSAGYQSMIWMVFDIAYRMAVLNPCMKERIAETSGVVLIDEIDMHLHPKWQWNIINALRTVFPNVQFIAATHAPILFASAENVWLIDVDQHEIHYDMSRYGRDANSILREVMRVEERPVEVRKLLSQFYRAIDEDNVTAAEELLNRIEGIVGGNDPEVSGAWVSLDFAKMRRDAE